MHLLGMFQMAHTETLRLNLSLCGLNQALVPYYRQILPMLNLFTRQNGAYDRQDFMDTPPPRACFRYTERDASPSSVFC